ncbi:hypothetical protein YPPY64_2792, partial [Yersinia pestis PY-64]
MAGRLPPRR